MKATPENAVKRKIKELLNSFGVFYYSATAGPYSTCGIPDIVGCHKGQFFGVEAKAPGKKATALQLMQRDRIVKSGGAWFLVDGETSLKELEEWLECL